MRIDRLATEVRSEDGTVVISLQGELDLAASGALDATIAAAAHDGPDVIIDLTALTFLDSTGLRAILEAVKTARDQGAAVAIVPGPVHVHRVFELTGTDRELTFVS